MGSISGLGGGSIIKPVLDTIGFHSVAEISFYSAIAVFTMATVSSYKQIRAGFKVNVLFILLLSIGSVIGGSAGNYALLELLSVYDDPTMVSIIQIVITILTLVFSYLYTKFYSQIKYKINDNYSIIVGFVLGFLASFLGIGGGPLNVVLLMCLFSLDIKTATIYSVMTIFFSQLSKLSSIYLTKEYLNYDISYLWYIIPAAILGGYLGAFFSKKMSDNNVRKIYQFVIMGILLINIYNLWNLF